jgi:hypothetical protein
MRIAHPCSEDLPSMPRAPGGVHCSRCERDVIDLRRVPRKRALAILAEKRETSGRVCAWVRATEDGTPVFAPDPSRLARLAGPALVATALAACSPTTSSQHGATPVTLAHESVAPTTPRATSSGGNTNAPPPVAISASTVPPRAPIQPASNVQPVTIEMAGDMAF